MRLLRSLAISAVLFAPLAAGAQFLPEPVQYIVTPEVPGPKQQVTVEVQGVGTFLGDATITWQQDGKTMQSGVGLRTYSFTTGALGSATRIHVDIKSSEGGVFSKDFAVRPSAIHLVWEADTTTPPLYKGKPLYSGGSPLKVVAFPTVVISGSRVAAQSLSYQWSRNDQVLAAQSGLGHSTLLLDGDQLQQQEIIEVDVYFGSTLAGRGSTVVSAAQPQIVIYERDSLRGTLFDNALPQDISLNAAEITLLAQPYYFGRAAVAGGQVQYVWDLNGTEIVGPDSAQGLITLRQTSSGQGSASLRVSAQNNNENMLVQSASAALRILFGGQSSGSLFGI